MKAGSTSDTMENEKRFRPVSYTLLFLMMACVSLTLSILIHSLLPNSHASTIAGILLLVVMDRLYTYRQLKALTPWSSEWAMAFGVQWVVIIFFIRVLLSYTNGSDALIADFSRIIRGNLADFFSPEFTITLILAFAMWELITQFLSLLDEIGLDMKLAWRDEQPVHQGETVPAH